MPHGGCVSGFQVEESQPTPKMHLYGHIFGVGIEGRCEVGVGVEWNGVAG